MGPGGGGGGDLHMRNCAVLQVAHCVQRGIKFHTPPSKSIRPAPYKQQERYINSHKYYKIRPASNSGIGKFGYFQSKVYWFSVKSEGKNFWKIKVVNNNSHSEPLEQDLKHKVPKPRKRSTVKQCSGSMTFLEWIRIRGSMPLTNGSGSCYFRH